MSTGALAIDAFKKPITVTRYASAISYVKGRAILPAPSIFTIDASVQQARPNEMDLLPEGVRISETKKIFSVSELKTATDQTNPTDADIVTFDGNDYRVLRVDKYSMGTLDHFRSFAAKINEDHN